MNKSEPGLLAQGSSRENSSAAPPQELSAEHIRHLTVLADRRALLAMLPGGGVVAELGVDKGDFSGEILAINQPAKLHLIDPWNTARFGEAQLALVRKRFEAELAQENVVVHRGYSRQELAQFPAGYFDWIYIDTDHSYETTAAELRLCKTKVRPGGVIAGHDYTTGNIKKSLRYGVIEAVNEFCVRYGWEMVYLTNEPRRYLSYALREISG